MTSLHRVVLAWSGTPVVGTAVTVLHFDGSNQSAPPVAALKTAFETQKALFNGNVTITFPNSGDTIDDRTGELTGVWTSAGGGTVTGTDPGSPMSGVGACISWNTGGIVVGSKGPRKLRGRTFIVPLAASVCAPDGKLQAVALTRVQAIASGMQGAGPLAVWHRPTSAAATDGNSYGVLGFKVTNKLAFLSSRRD